jgi:hypothetical protein
VSVAQPWFSLTQTDMSRNCSSENLAGSTLTPGSRKGPTSQFSMAGSGGLLAEGDTVIEVMPAGS